MSVEVPPAVRAAVVGLAAEVLGALEPTAVPSALAAVRRFAPRRRADAGAGPLWRAVEVDDAFRARVARAWSHAHPGEAAELLVLGRPADPADPEHLADPENPKAPEDHVPGAEESPRAAQSAGPPAPPAEATEPVGEPPGEPAPRPSVAAPDPLTLAVGAVLLRPPGWQDVVQAVAAAEQPAHGGHAGSASDDDTPPAAVRAGSVPEAGPAPAPDAVHRVAARLAAEQERADAAEAELASLRKELRRLRSDADRARAEARRSAERAAEVAAAAEQVHAEAAAVRARAEEERRRAEELVRAAREDAAVLRDLAEVRVRLLLDTLVEAGSALREELALPPAGAMPADLVAPAPVPGPAGRATSRGRGADDPALLDELLAMPRAHLVVDGYNVSKLAWPDVPLAEQRRRLTGRLANLAGRTGAEVTCCFDGREPGPHDRAPGGPRGVRVLFSQGEIADDLIRRLVRAEPTGRVVVAVTADRALGADLEAAGARVLPSATLLARLGRV
ncbi:NYN domain-containing protein [Cellulomonas sp. C5510]|uniref:NYN domain-containing protein n=1 Tax=Cellulomonas sp. C5510 TaxID=2871170 RepID=UPI002104D8BA|nr:NYN domain-containing protein [Cellulomonas sp. C5510]